MISSYKFALFFMFSKNFRNYFNSFLLSARHSSVICLFPSTFYVLRCVRKYSGMKLLNSSEFLKPVPAAPPNQSFWIISYPNNSSNYLFVPPLVLTLVRRALNSLGSPTHKSSFSGASVFGVVFFETYKQ